MAALRLLDFDQPAGKGLDVLDHAFTLESDGARPFKLADPPVYPLCFERGTRRRAFGQHQLGRLVVRVRANVNAEACGRVRSEDGVDRGGVEALALGLAKEQRP